MLKLGGATQLDLKLRVIRVIRLNASGLSTATFGRHRTALMTSLASLVRAAFNSSSPSRCARHHPHMSLSPTFDSQRSCESVFSATCKLCSERSRCANQEQALQPTAVSRGEWIYNDRATWVGYEELQRNSFDSGAQRRRNARGECFYGLQ